MSSTRFDTLSSALLVFVALSMFAIFLYDRRQSVASNRASTANYVEDWQLLNQSGIRLGGAEEASLIVTEFMDFTCPHCARLAPVIDSLLVTFPDQVAVIFHYFPLRGRDLSMPSAIAAECAAEQGKFREMYSALYGYSDSLDVWEWNDFARHAGLSDLDSFQRCISRPVEDFERIALGRRIGEENGVMGTPTVWVNGLVVRARTVSEFIGIAEDQGISLRR